MSGKVIILAGTHRDLQEMNLIEDMASQYA